MSGLGPIPPLQTLGIGIADAALIAVVLTGGLVGMSIRNMFDSILSDDGEPADVDASDTTTQQADGEEAGMADGGLMAEEGGDFGELGGMDDEGGDPIDVSDVRLSVRVDGEALSEQPPVPFFSASGFEPGPTGAFNSASDGVFEPGERARLSLAATNAPHFDPGDRVTVRIHRADTTVATASVRAG